MKGRLMAHIDQYGNIYYAKTICDLKNKVGGGRVRRMMTDLINGGVAHIGYVIGQHWLRAFVPYQGQA